MGFDLEFSLRLSKGKNSLDEPAEDCKDSDGKSAETCRDSKDVSRPNPQNQIADCSESLKKGFFTKCGEQLGTLTGKAIFLLAAVVATTLGILLKTFVSVL